jgi:imidazolonepropionase-like amidohydrolase
MRRLFAFLTGALLLAIAGLTAQYSFAQSSPSTVSQPTSSILFENVRVFSGTSTQLSAPSNVLVVDNKIQRVSATSVTPPAGTQVTRINGGGRVLMPGLIDNHVHIWMSASTQDDILNPAVSPEILEANATQEAEQMLLRGFTTVRDLGGPVFGLKAAIDAGETPGPRIYPSGGTISQTSGHGDFRALNERPRRFGGAVTRPELLGATFIADGRDDVLTATRENLRFGATQIKVMAGGGAASLYDPLDVTEYTLDEVKAAVDAAEDWGTYVTVHAYTPRAVQRSLEAGVKCIEHGQLLDEETMKLLAEKGAWLSLQALDPAPPNASPVVREKKQRVVDGTDNAFRWAKQYNVNLAWGTDFLFNPDNNKNQNADIPKLTKWLTPAEVLKLITYGNAQVFKLSGERNPYPGKLGEVSEGAYADLLLVEGNPLEDVSVLVDYSNNFKVIVKDGKVYKNTLS